MYSRYNDLTMVECEDCGWRGQVKECVHTYRGITSTEDVEAVDECPKCGSKILIEPGMAMAERR